MKRVVHILMSDYRLDSRVRNETESLSKNGYSVDVLCLSSEKTLQSEIRDGVRIIRCGWTSISLIKLLSAYLSFAIYIIRTKPSLVHCHDFTGYFIGFLITRVIRVPVIYDSHELWSQALHEKKPKWVLALAFFVERKIAKSADSVITVSPAIERYLKNYFKNDRVFTVLNTPSYVKHIARPLSNTEKQLVFLYQGLITEARGLPLIIDAVELLKHQRFKFLIVGDGPYLKQLKNEVQIRDLNNFFEFTGFISQDHLYKYSQAADVGVHSIQNSCLNHDYCLPNKLFEYVQSGLVVLCSNLQELNRVITEHNLGITFEEGNAQDLAKKMNQLIENRGEFRALQESVSNAKENLSWKVEEKKLLNVYDGLLN